MSTEMQTKVQASPAQSFTPAQTGLLQRKSALCNTPGLVENSKRDQENLTLQRSSVDQTGTTTVPPIDSETRDLMEPRFGHDFSRVSVHSKGPGMIQTKLRINEPQVQRQTGVEEDNWEKDKEFDLNYKTQEEAKKRVFSLTFDDGPHTAELKMGINRTEKVLDTLKSKGVKGGFFIQTGVRGKHKVGKILVKRMEKEGHKVGIHTGGTIDHESHPSAEVAGRLTSELTDAKNYINTETKVTPDLVRPPYGKSNTEVEKVYNKLGLTKLLWDIRGDYNATTLTELKTRLDSSDPDEPGIPAIHARGWKGTTPSHPKIVILYHDLRQATADNIGLLIDHIKSATSTATGGTDTADFAPP